MHHWIIRYRIWIILVSVLFTLGALLLLPKIEVNPDLESYIPEQIENKKHLKVLDSIFGGNEMIMVLINADDVLHISTLNRIQKLTRAFNNLEGIQRCISPLDAQDIYMDNGMMVIHPMFEEFPENEDEIDKLKKKLKNNKLAARFFVDDFSMATLYLLKESTASDNELILQIQDIIDENPGSEEVLLGGLPFVRFSISGNINNDLIYLLPAALILMVLMLYISFKEWKGVFIPFTIVVMSMILSFGVMALLGWKMSLITILLPIMLIAIANDYGIHMVAHYQELASRKPNYNMAEICRQIYIDLKKPIIITGLTTIGGVLGLLTHTMVPAAQLGVLAAFGIAFALILSIWFLPALLSFFTPAIVIKKPVKNLWLTSDGMLNMFSRLVTKHPIRVLIVSTIVGLFGLSGLFLLRVDTNIEGYFLGKSEVSRSIKLINEKLGGSSYISVLFTGDVLSPDILKRMEAYETELQNDPIIGSIHSPVTLLKELSKGFYEKDESQYGQIPETADEAYQSMEIFTMGGNGEAAEQFLDYNYENARILISLNDGSNRAGKRILKKLQEITADDPNVAFIAGTGLTTIQLADLVINGQINSLILALSVVFVLLSLIFRSVNAGIISAIPLSIAVLVLFGLMGYLGIAIDIATALLSSIMIGVGIDYTIHFIWRFKKELATGLEHKIAAHNTLITTGRGIIFNALSVIIGFLALTFSNFAPLRFFGALVVISITTCLLSALMLIPSILIILKPKFLNKKI